MSNWHPLWSQPSAEELSVGSSASPPLRPSEEGPNASATTSTPSPRYRDGETLNHHARAVAYEKAMEEIYLRYPDDREGAIFYALTLNATASPSDRIYSNQKKAAQILNALIFSEAAEPPGRSPLSHSQLRTLRRLPNWGCRRRCAVRRLRLRCLTRFTCRHIFSRDWANGGTRSIQTAHRWPRAKTTRFVTMARAWPGISRCTPWTISNTRTCNLGGTMPAKELVDDV